MLLAMACDGIDCAGLRRNHTNGEGRSQQSLAVSTPNSVRSVRALGAAPVLGIGYIPGAVGPVAEQGRAVGSWKAAQLQRHWDRN